LRIGAVEVKNLPGRPERDPPGSRWLAVCFERGPVTPCLAAMPEFRKRARAEISQLEEALEGAEFFTARHAVLLKAMLDRTGRLTARTGQPSQVTGELLAPCGEQQQAEPVPGRARRSAQDAITGTGAGMTRFADGAHLASWAGRVPLARQSGARSGKARRKRGHRYLGAVPGETATAAGRTDTREGARHRRIARRGARPGMRRHGQHPDARLPQAAVQAPEPVTRTLAHLER
jgi:hypothetical protein